MHKNSRCLATNLDVYRIIHETWNRETRSPNLRLNFLPFTFPAGRTCQTPDSKPGYCISIKSCDYLYQLMVADGRNPKTIEYLRKSQCGQLFENGVPVVCCADSPNGNTVLKPTSTSRPTTTPAPVNYGECGKSEKKDTRIVGGRNATLGSYKMFTATF